MKKDEFSKSLSSVYDESLHNQILFGFITGFMFASPNSRLIDAERAFCTRFSIEYTAEDYELLRRARRVGKKIINSKKAHEQQKK